MAKKTAPEIPDFIDMSQPGWAVITLSRPATIAGAQVHQIAMREPTVDDQLAAEKLGEGGQADKMYMANLCQLAPEDIGRLPLRDFKRLQTAFIFFLD